MDKQFKNAIKFSSLVWFTINFHHPVNPTFFTQLDLPSHVFGTSLAMLVFAEFLTSPIWGTLGDRYGRKMTLVYSTIFYGITQIVYGMSTRLWHVLLLRAVAGIFSGGFLVGFLALVIDIGSRANKGERVATYSAFIGEQIA